MYVKSGLIFTYLKDETDGQELHKSENSLMDGDKTM